MPKDETKCLVWSLRILVGLSCGVFYAALYFALYLKSGTQAAERANPYNWNKTEILYTENDDEADWEGRARDMAKRTKESTKKLLEPVERKMAKIEEHQVTKELLKPVIEKPVMSC